MMGIVENLIGQPRFHDLPLLHNQEPMGDEADHRQVMSDHHSREGKLLNQAAQ